jgi:small subunit ribosomal protein S20
MPVIKSAKKKARQAKRHEERNKGLRTRVKSTLKKVMVLSKTDVEAAKKFLPEAYSVIDTACKKHLLHRNNAARKKSLMARQVASGKTVAAAEKKAPAVKKAAKAEKKVVEKEIK